MTEELQKKVNRAVKLIKVSVGDGEVEVSYSGGKDSDVILELTRMAGVKYRAIYKNTTIDPPHTRQHCEENGVEVLMPKLPFLKLIEKCGYGLVRFGGRHTPTPKVTKLLVTFTKSCTTTFTAVPTRNF